ncbi:pyridoxal phosphate-dependent aminotransferase [Bacillus sp. 2205SS5-2]|uniref:pyridoxal phosphate-dependent aminotransferase n=1 Tax=Bacillus sp. 2205SS5-2 TaxID=3109031 RepID=UPI00300485BB
MKNFPHSQTINDLPDQFFAVLAHKVQSYTSKGYDIINLGQGNPDQPTPEHIVRSLQKASENPQHHKYPPFRGNKFFREGIATFYKRDFGVEIDPNTEVAILFGAKSGLVEVSQCFLNRGDIALVPDPGYPDYWSGIALAQAHMESMPLTKQNQFLPDYSKIDPATLNKAKLMFLNYPNNPTGAIATEAFFQETIELANQHEFCVVHDFAYGAIGFDNQKPFSFMQFPGAKEIGIEVYTLSKTYNMAGWRVGFAVGNKSVIEALNKLQDHLYCSLFGAVQEAATTALLGSQQCVEELKNRYELRRNTWIQGLNNIGWKVEAPAGSFFTWLPVPTGFTSESFTDFLLEKAHVAVAPGIGFGTHGEGYVRCALLCDEARLKEAIQRINKLAIF